MRTIWSKEAILLKKSKVQHSILMIWTLSHGYWFSFPNKHSFVASDQMFVGLDMFIAYELIFVASYLIFAESVAREKRVYARDKGWVATEIRSYAGKIRLDATKYLMLYKSNQII